GTFASGSSIAAEAANIAAAINACNSSYPAVGVTASYTSGSTFTVSSVAPGPYLAVGASNNTGLFSWGTVTAGSAGSNTCAYWSGAAYVSTAQVATNIAAAINANAILNPLVTATSNGNIVTVTANTPGTAGNSYGTTVVNFPGFAWGGATLSGGVAGAI